MLKAYACQSCTVDKRSCCTCTAVASEICALNALERILFEGWSNIIAIRVYCHICLFKEKYTKQVKHINDNKAVEEHKKALETVI